MRLIERRNVDLPQPDEPISAVTLFGSIVMLTSLHRQERRRSRGSGPASTIGLGARRRRHLVVLSVVIGSLADLRAEAAVDQAREQVEHHHDEDQRERGRPRAVDRRLGRHAGRLVRVEGEDRRGSPCGRRTGWRSRRSTTPVVISSGAVSPMMRAIASITPVTMPAERGRQHDLDDRPPLRHAERVGRLAQAVGHDPQHLLGGAHDDRDHQHRQRDRAHDARGGRPGRRRSRTARTRTGRRRSTGCRS